MRFICAIGAAEHIVEAESAEAAARIAATREFAHNAESACRCVTVNVAEANEADLPLIAGEDYEVAFGSNDLDS